MNIRFDDNDNLVIEDIPDDLMIAIERRASANERSVEEEVRAIITERYGSDPGDPA